MVRQFNQAEMKKIRRGQRKYKEELSKFCESVVEEFNKNNTYLEVFADRHCNYCYGKGQLNFSHPSKGVYSLPCDCSIKNKAKTLYLEAKKVVPVWEVENDGVVTKVYAKSLKEIVNG